MSVMEFWECPALRSDIQLQLSTRCPHLSLLSCSLLSARRKSDSRNQPFLFGQFANSPRDITKTSALHNFSLWLEHNHLRRVLLYWLTPAAPSTHQTTTWLAMNPMSLFTVPRHSPGSCDGKELTNLSFLVLDLPQIYTKPSGTELMKALDLLAIKPRSFSTDAHEDVERPSVQPAGVTHYLTSIVASPLSWLDNDQLREAVWDAASARISERSGRTGRWSVRLQ